MGVGGKRIGLGLWKKLFWWGEDAWRHWQRERVALVTRCLRLECELQQARYERDDWFQIARTLAHRLDEPR